jgi:hypothetical protein
LLAAVRKRAGHHHVALCAGRGQLAVQAVAAQGPASCRRKLRGRLSLDRARA